MKKIFLTILITAICVCSTYAQKGFSLEIIAQPQNTWGGDFQVPTSMSNFNFSNFVPMTNKLNFAVQTGISLSYGFNKIMGISLGILYSPQGQTLHNFNSENDVYTGNITVNTNYQRNVSLKYLKIPVQFYFNPNPEKKISFYCSAGFYLGFLLDYKDVFTINENNSDPLSYTATGNNYTETGLDSWGNISTDVYPFVTNPYNSFDFGTTLSAGLQIKLSDKMSIPIMLNYQFGFIDIKNHASSYADYTGIDSPFWDLFVNSNYTSPNQTLSYHNSLLGLSIGLKIKL